MSGIKFTFVHSTSEGTVRQSEKLRVRSHCMKGKNKRQDSRRSLRQARRTVGKETEDAEGTGEVVPNQALSVASGLYHSLPETALIPLVGDCDRSSREVLHQFLQYARLKHAFYSTDYFVDFDKHMTNHKPWLLTDDAFFHSVIMSTSATQDFLLRRPFSTTALYHLRKTLTLLNRRLSDDDMYKMESTIWIILTLAMTAGFFLDFASTGTHIAGLRQIVHLRGGRRFLEARPKMQHKLENLEFSFCLTSGSVPQLWGPPVTWQSILNIQSVTPINMPLTLSANAKLVTVFYDLRELAAIANRHVAQDLRLDGLFFQTTMSSIRYRLLFLLEDEEVRGLPCECLCLGMLAFLTTMFAIPGRRILYPYLTERVRGASWEGVISSSEGCHSVGIWLLLTCAMTVVDAGEECLRRSWMLISEPNAAWETIREEMLGIAWLCNIHDSAGQEAFSQLNKLHHTAE